MMSSTTEKIIRVRQLVDFIGLSRSTIYAKLNPNSPYFDPGFPKPIKLGRAAVGWSMAELKDWLTKRKSDA